MNEEPLLTSIFGASIEFGVGSLRDLVNYLENFGVQRLLIVTDAGVIKAGIIEKVVEQLEKSSAKYWIFDRVQPNPTDDNVMDGIEEYIKNQCNAILGVGGGSSIDTAKAIRILASNPGHIRNYYAPAVIGEKMPVLIAIPTTSGTGSEVSGGGIITDTMENRKRVVRSGPPSLALVDPILTLGMPPSLTAATGMDALSHNIEAYVSKRYNPFAEAIAIAGIKLVAENLRRAVEDGKDIEARKNMAMASTMGALAFAKGLGAVHSLAHQLSTDADVPHGVANAIMLPYVMEYNMEDAIRKHIDIAQAMGVNVYSKSAIEAARSSIDAVRKLSSDIGIPERLRDVGVKEDSIPMMAKKAMSDHCHAANPKECIEESMSALYKVAF